MENLIVNERLLKRDGIENLLSGRILLPEKIQRGEIPGRIRRTKRISFIKSDSRQPRILSSSENHLKAGREIIKGLEKTGLEAKPFCFHVLRENENLFVVKGSDFKWALVRIADYSEQDKIPSEMFRKLAVLKQHRVKYDGIWIAFPMESHAREIIDSEMKAMSENAIAFAGCIFALPFTIVAGIMDAAINDPALVVQFNNLYVEFGRWE
ncbi:MAG: hypothetical protein Q8L26_08435 [Candidatus Omnitrophota bacterium]|nr:hypothetical protein [Candidatus Omnitrophota bacterium]